jgi:predicted metal-binding protein
VSCRSLTGTLEGYATEVINAKDNMLRHTVFICSTCQNGDEAQPKGDELAMALKAIFTKSDDPAVRDFNIETFACMSACANPMAISFRAHGKAAYMFSGINPAKDQNDILAFAKLYVAAKDGWIEDARPCGRLRHCLLGRIPADPVMVSE